VGVKAEKILKKRFEPRGGAVCGGITPSESGFDRISDGPERRPKVWAGKRQDGEKENDEKKC